MTLEERNVERKKHEDSPEDMCEYVDDSRRKRYAETVMFSTPFSLGTLLVIKIMDLDVFLVVCIYGYLYNIFRLNMTKIIFELFSIYSLFFC